MRAMAAAALGAVAPWLEADNQRQIHDFHHAVGTTDRDRSFRRRLSQKFGMFDGQRSTVRQVNVERLEGTSLVQLTKLFDSHADILAQASVARNEHIGHLRWRL